MRTLHLQEYRTQTEGLTSRELRDLLAIGLVRVQARGDGLYDLITDSRVGTAVSGSLRLLIRPKVSIENVFFMLGYAAGLTEWDARAFPYERDPDLLSAIAHMLDAEMTRCIQYGLIRDYSTVQVRLPTIRGRVDIGRQIRTHQSRALPLECRYQEFSHDIPLNQLLRAAHETVLRAFGGDSDLARRTRHRVREFGEVRSIRYRPGTIPHIRFNRLNRQWEPAVRLSELILRHDSLRDQTGGIMGASFTVDMNKVFERFVETIAREEARKLGYEFEGQARRRLTRWVRMKPDIVLRRDYVDVAVADAKYKELAIDAWPHADIYQLLAYCVALRLPRGLLIYAESGKDRDEIVDTAGITLEVRGIDLSGARNDILSRTRAVIARLMEHLETDSERAPHGSNLTQRRGG
jgi:5-methylcytosine-specific restriction enzyme subunit McrC